VIDILADPCSWTTDVYRVTSLRVDRMEKEGVRGAAESSLHALSSAAGASSVPAWTLYAQVLFDVVLATSNSPALRFLIREMPIQLSCAQEQSPASQFSTSVDTLQTSLYRSSIVAHDHHILSASAAHLRPIDFR
jgi:hypothetical protein